MTAQPSITHTHTWDGVSPLPDRDTHPQPGWLIIEWSDGTRTIASPQVADRVYGPDGLAGRLARAEAALAGEEPADTSRPTRRVHVTITNPDAYTANRAALSLVDWINAEFPAHHVTTDAREWEQPDA